MKDSEWWKPANLEKSQKQYASNKPISMEDADNDFGSYKIMRIFGDFQTSRIKYHNDVKPRYRVVALDKILKKRNFQNILDVGCGLGFTASALKNVYKSANVTGIDISKDAIEFAKKKFPECDFYCNAIDPNDTKQHLPYDLITAFEFYPFSRTENMSDHIAYINHLTKNMPEQSCLVIFQLWNNNKSISINYDSIKNHYKDFDFKEYKMPFRRLGLYLPSRLIANLISDAIQIVFRLILNKHLQRNKFIIITVSKPNENTPTFTS